MSNEGLGRMKEVDVRSFWPNEARKFTPWIAKEGGLDLLSETLNMELELEGCEVPVGPYSADIVARDASSGEGEKVVIENQLGKTDHGHLGQCLLYASGLNASTVIWIATEFTDEYSRALGFLNDMASPRLRFYGLEIRLWSISGSPPAPQFNVVVRPSEYAQSVRLSEQKLTEAQSIYLEFWKAFRDYMNAKNTFLRTRRPQPQMWYSIAVGRSGFEIVLQASVQKKYLSCDVHMSGPRPNDYFGLLDQQKTAIEEQLGVLEWLDMPEANDCRIVQYKTDVDIRDKDNWRSHFEWLKDRAESFHQVFGPRIAALQVPDADGENEAEDGGEGGE